MIYITVLFVLVVTVLFYLFVAVSFFALKRVERYFWDRSVRRLMKKNNAREESDIYLSGIRFSRGS